MCKEHEDIIREQGREISRLKRRLAALEKQLRELTAAPRPPAFVKATVHPPPDPKPRGPPPNHEPHHRPLPEPDETLMVTLPKCPGCNEPLGEPLEYVDHTVEDVIPGRRVVRRYRQARYRCSGCGQFHLARPPGVLPNSRFGPDLLLLLAILRLRGMSAGNIVTFLALVFGLHLSDSTVLNLEQRVARELQPLYEQIREALRTRNRVNGDETGWRVDGVPHWLWVFSSAAEAIFTVDRSRSGKVPLEVLGEKFQGVIVRDGWSAYNSVGCPQQQCLVHIHRDIQELEAQRGIEPRPLREERPPRFTRRGHPPTELLGFVERLRAILREAVQFHEKVKDTPSRRKAAARFQQRLNRLLRPAYRDEDAESMAEGLRRRRHQMFTFLRFPNVPWHNNDAERDLRASVVVRKMSFGSRSMEGARCHAVLRSVELTCRRRGWDFRETVRGHLGGNGVVSPWEASKP